ncbi:MAG: TIGR01841 family phasin, partial [Proteobacteria bacterium]|nr:TIGR01841 family phasin [Pseudomonadota bacterium]
NSEAAKALFSAKSFNEAVELQGEIARKSFDKSLSEGTKLSELSLKVANEAFQPIQQQFTAAVAKAGKIAA